MKNKLDKESERLLDEIFEGKEEVNLMEGMTTEERILGMFRILCNLSNKLVEIETPDMNSNLLVIKRDLDVEQINIKGKDSIEVKNILKDKDMLGYMISMPVTKKDINRKVIGNAIMRTLYTPKLFIKNIIDVDGSKPIILNDRAKLFDDFDMWALIENPKGEQ